MARDTHDASHGASRPIHHGNKDSLGTNTRRIRRDQFRAATRRRWRRFYRRSRLYLPFAVLLILVLVVTLPLSPRWLTRVVQGQVAKRTGLPVTIQQARIQIITSEVDLYGIELAGNGKDEEPFRINEIHLRGRLSDLLAGDGRWPSVVEITGVSPLKLVPQEEGMVPVGAALTIQRAIEKLGAGKKVPSKSSNSTQGARPTPELIVRGLSLEAVPPSENMPPLKISIDSLVVPDRPSANSAIQATVSGLAVAGTAEPFTGAVMYLPDEQRASLRAQLHGLEVPFALPTIGGVLLDASELQLEVTARRREDNDVEITVESDAEQFDISETSPMGEHWSEKELRLVARAIVDDQGAWLKVTEVLLRGRDIDVRGAGDVALTQELTSDLHVSVRRLPERALAVARRQLRNAGVSLDPLTSATLTFDFAAKGSLADPMAMAYDGSVVMENWEIFPINWPKPITVQRAMGRVTPEFIDFPRVKVSMGGLEATGSARLPLLEGDATDTATLTLQVRGEPVDALDLAKHFGVLPRELNGFTTPLNLDMKCEFLVGAPGPDGTIRVNPDESIIDATLSWGKGQVSLRGLPNPIELDSGAVKFSPQGTNLSHLRARYGDVAMDADVLVSSIKRGFLPAYSATLIADGPIPGIREIIESWLQLPMRPDEILGHVHAQVDVTGTIGDWENIAYSARLDLRDGAGIIKLPYSQLSLDQVSASIEATPESIRINRLSGRIDQDAKLTASGEITRDAISITAEAETSMATAAKVSPPDFRDLVVDGRASARATVSLTPHDALDPAADTARAWAAAFVGPKRRAVGISDDSPLRLRIKGQIYPGAGATIYQRDFPHPITDVRGDISADETGFYITKAHATFGASKDVVVSGYVKLAYRDQPLEIVFDARAPELNINDWMEGWGTQPWAERPFVRPPRPASPGGEPFMWTRISGTAQIGRTQFLNARGTDATVNMTYEVWEGADNVLTLDKLRAAVYGGRLEGTAKITFPDNGTLPRFETEAMVRGAQARDFLTDILERPEEFTGLYTGGLFLSGEIGDYSTWKGEGNYAIVESRFIGQQSFKRLSTALNLGQEQQAANTRFEGTGYIENLQVRLPDMRAESSAIRCLADGLVDFSGNIDFLITVDVLSNRLANTPIISDVSNWMSELMNALVSFRLQGTLQNPEIKTVPTVIDSAGFFKESGKKGILKAEEMMKSGKGVLGRGLRFATEKVEPPALFRPDRKKEQDPQPQEKKP